MSTLESPSEADANSGELPEIAARILAAAINLFARKGYTATSVREIVQEANVTNPMLYYYFDSKEGLFQFLTDLLHREFRRQISEVIDADLPLEETLVGVVDVHLSGLRDNPRILEFVFNLLFGAEGSCPEHRLMESHDTIMDALQMVFRRAIDQGTFEPNPRFELTWLVHQLLGIVNSHTMRGIKELQRCKNDAETAAWIRDNAGRDTARQLVRFFLQGAGEVRNE